MSPTEIAGALSLPSVCLYLECSEGQNVIDFLKINIRMKLHAI